jgi:leader peptidase (prepilin peptidase)/N-methyltransferase
VGTSCAGLAVALRWADRPLAAALLVTFTIALGVLTDVDLREQRLPNVIVGPLTASTLIGVIAAGAIGGDLPRAAIAMAVGLAFSAVLLALSLTGQVGMGDVKLALPIGVVAGWLGPGAIQATVLTTSISGGLAAAALLLAGRGRKHTLPYGPFLAIGSVVGIAA